MLTVNPPPAFGAFGGFGGLGALGPTGDVGAVGGVGGVGGGVRPSSARPTALPNNRPLARSDGKIVLKSFMARLLAATSDRARAASRYVSNLQIRGSSS